MHATPRDLLAAAAALALAGAAVFAEQPADEATGAAANDGTVTHTTADDDAPEPAVDPAQDPYRLHISFVPTATHVFQSELEDSDGTLSSTRVGAKLVFSKAFTPTVSGSLNINNELTWFGFDGLTGIVTNDDDPVDLGKSIDISPAIFVKVNDRWAWFARFDADFSWADDASFTDGFTFAGYGGVRWQARENLALSFGIGGGTRLESDGVVLPIFAIEWDITDRWRLATEGPGLELSYKIDDDWTAFGFGRYERREYRLGDSEGLIDDGVMRHHRFYTGVGVKWQPDRRFDVTLSGGVLVFQDVEFYDDDGNEIRDHDTDPAGFVSLVGRISF